AAFRSGSLVRKIEEAIKKILEWLFLVFIRAALRTRVRAHLSTVTMRGRGAPMAPLDHLRRRNIYDGRLHFGHDRGKGARHLHRIGNRKWRAAADSDRRMRCAHA